MEAVFILVAFRRVAQFSDNQRERTAHYRNEKACAYDHDSHPAGSQYDGSLAVSILSFLIEEGFFGSAAIATKILGGCQVKSNW